MTPDWLERVLNIDSARSPEDRSRARAIGVIILFLLLILSLITLIHLALGDPTAVDTSLGIAACLLALLLLRQGYLDLVRWLVPALMFALITYIAATNLGVTDEAIFAYPALIALAGLLLGQRGVIAATLASVLAFAGMGIWQMRGWLPGAASDVTANRLVVVPVLMGLMGMVILLVIRNLLHSLKALGERDKALEASNRELQAIRDSLEAQVLERTQRADQARIEAEEATLAMQAQVWLAVGQAELSERMRGEQTLSSLANNIIRMLCDYLDAEVGALYVSQGGVYRFAAGFAFNPGESALTFRPGEGVLGQAVVDRQMVEISDLPPGQLVVSSGLGRVAPRHVMVAPFEYNDEVLGVLEIGKLDAFSPAEQKFLATVSSSIAIAFLTVRSRLRMAELLSQIQDQFTA